MSLAAPADLARAFSAAWAARDAGAIAALFAEDADFLSLTGGAAEGRAVIADLFAAEFAGTFARARLVTGRSKLRPLGPHAAVVLQRFVLSGLVHADGADAGRLGAVLMATLSPDAQGWQVVAAQFVAEA
ncbi:MAG: SgcJ/EcaC family oxidoreductase [Phaeovulum sp.]|uniref:SgcJ/EcaC family oxidoreductase n=1 Tax=Phaeovulum sp. TaxID=2934796 RepID=UPI0027349805|nr:SgcJ/EcaC family oxidoreductase [Phaeovulum sp.]MDP3861634.1 SgcJ/EcaC family oxidoreductase [Phaeovulum sp.]